MTDLTTSDDMRARVLVLQDTVRALPQYQPVTEHFFHGGMYCRAVFREAGVVVVGKVHRQEHFYFVAAGTVTITTDTGVETITGPCLRLCRPGTKRVVYAETDATCMTFHRTDARTVEEAEAELVEDEPGSDYGAGNVLRAPAIEVAA